jgi:dipeptidase D
METIILQAHMDMVCVKTSESNHDFLNDEIQTYEKD